VLRLLRSDLSERDLCIFVRDDCSTDDTYEAISSIEDSRLVVIRNQTNLGAAYNTHLCFLEAPSRFAYLTSDEDDLALEKLQELACMLADEEEASVVLVGGDLRYSNKRFPETRITEPHDALMRYGFSTRYMTGIVFNVEKYKTHIGEVAYDMAPQYWDSYSFMYAMAKLFCFGHVITKDGKWYQQNRLAPTSASNNARSDGVCYYEPTGRLNQMHTWLSAIQTLPLPQADSEELSVKVIFDCAQLLNAIFEPNYARLARLTASNAQYEAYCEKLSGVLKRDLCQNALDEGVSRFLSYYGYEPVDSLYFSTQKLWDDMSSKLTEAMAISKEVFQPVTLDELEDGFPSL